MIFNKTKKPRRPDFNIYNIEGDGDNAYWNKIGGAWAWKDGKGFYLQMDYLPLKAGKLALFKPDEKAGEDIPLE